MSCVQNHEQSAGSSGLRSHLWDRYSMGKEQRQSQNVEELRELGLNSAVILRFTMMFATLPRSVKTLGAVSYSNHPRAHLGHTCVPPQRLIAMIHTDFQAHQVTKSCFPEDRQFSCSSACSKKHTASHLWRFAPLSRFAKNRLALVAPSRYTPATLSPTGRDTSAQNETGVFLDLMCVGFRLLT